MRLVRHPELLLCWSDGDLLAQNLESKVRLRGGPEIAAILGLFDRPREAGAAAGALPRYGSRLVLAGIERLRRLGFLLPEAEARRHESRIEAWNDNVASAFYHVASRDLRYLAQHVGVERFVTGRLAEERRPARFKRYRVPVRVPLRVPGRAPADLEDTLRARRTVREFSRTAVPFEALAGVVQGTWGRTGTIEDGLLGKLLAKTSPSGGALHPIECYVLAWNVEGLPPGLYHYDVAANELRRLKRGDLRQAAVRAASGQRWVGRAGFLCVMTAVFQRTLWKYRLETAYRTVWLDAGHLAQSFCLLATARGLGPFTTAAIQDSFIEKLIGLDGIREFPVYLCGAGVRKRPRKGQP